MICPCTPLPLAGEAISAKFDFDRDTFAFANELVWRYRFDQPDGRLGIERCQPPPTYAHRCFVMVRSARQFFAHARFDPELPPIVESAYRGLIRQIVRRDPRGISMPEDRIVVPGFADLRTFSQAHERELKSTCGGAWQSYALRSHWRMVFPISRAHQSRTAEELVSALRAGTTPIIHLVRFPQLTINHGALLFGCRSHNGGIEFSAYDPNVPAQATTLFYNPTQNSFVYPRQTYWAGGRLDIIHIYKNWLF